MLNAPKTAPTVHPIPDERWPSREEAAASTLFSPLTLARGCSLATRTWVPAMVPWRATDDGFVTRDAIDWYGRFADGRPGAIVVEATGIRDVPSGPLLRAGHDRFIEGLSRLVDEVRARSAGETKAFLQILDFLAIKRRPEPSRYFERFLAITARHRERLAERTSDAQWIVADERDLRLALASLDDEGVAYVLTARERDDLRMGYRERVTDTHLAHIRELPRVLPGLFAEASRRAERAGFDGVELHYAHAYTMASFLSATNDRDDEYGGSSENRLRLPIEVLSAVRSYVGERFVVGCRFLGDEVIDGGSRVADAARYGVAFARAGMDFLSVSKGGRFEDARQPAVGEAAYPYTGPSGHECMPTVRSDERGPFGRNLHLSRSVREAVRAAGCETPVVAAGGITGFRIAERALVEGDADVIAAARQSLADPDWWLKMREGRGGDVRRCRLTNYCEALDQRHKQVTCQLWDRRFIEGEGEVARSHDGRRRLTAPRWR